MLYSKNMSNIPMCYLGNVLHVYIMFFRIKSPLQGIQMSLNILSHKGKFSLEDPSMLTNLDISKYSSIPPSHFSSQGGHSIPQL